MASNERSSEQIKLLIRSGERARALSLIKVLIQLEPENPEAWWLLSFASEDPQKQLAAKRS